MIQVMSQFCGTSCGSARCCLRFINGKMCRTHTYHPITKRHPVRTGCLFFWSKEQHIIPVCIVYLAHEGVATFTGGKTREIMGTLGFFSHGLRNMYAHVLIILSNLPVNKMIHIPLSTVFTIPQYQCQQSISLKSRLGKPAIFGAGFNLQLGRETRRPQPPKQQKGAAQKHLR